MLGVFVMQEKLEKVLLSKKVVDEFYKQYEKKEFRKWINGIIPEVEDCKNQQQDNPWHIYNCLDHILHSVEEINKQTENMDYNTRKILAYTMFFHDIGKPKCHLRRFSKLYGREVDSFFNHNFESEKIAIRALPNLGFDKEQSKIISTLVREHDVFLSLTLEDDGNKFHRVLTTEVLKEIVNRFNGFENKIQMTKMLAMVGRADNLAQNPKMTKESLHKVDVFEKMLENLENQENEVPLF